MTCCGQNMMLEQYDDHGRNAWTCHECGRAIPYGCGRKLGPFDCCTVVEGDCLELMKQLPDGCVDAVITDPPYGTGYYEYDVCGYPALSEYARNLRTLAAFGYPEALVGWCVAERLEPTEWVTWFPTNKACGRSIAALPKSSEAIAIFGEVLGADSLFRPRSVDRFSERIIKSRGLSVDMARLEDVWITASPGMGFNYAHRLHPNEKPLVVMTNLVTLCSLPDETILDPFLGSGTTAVAAKKLGRHFLGFEISPEYCRIARERIALVEAQPSLFEQKPEQLEL